MEIRLKIAGNAKPSNGIIFRYNLSKFERDRSNVSEDECKIKSFMIYYFPKLFTVALDVAKTLLTWKYNIYSQIQGKINNERNTRKKKELKPAFSVETMKKNSNSKSNHADYFKMFTDEVRDGPPVFWPLLSFDLFTFTDSL